MIPEGREGQGWSYFATELSKGKVFFDSTVGKGITVMVLRQLSSVPSSSEKEVGFGVGKGTTHLGVPFCVCEGLEVFGSGPKDCSLIATQKSTFIPKTTKSCNKGVKLRAGSSLLLVCKPNAKRAT